MNNHTTTRIYQSLSLAVLLVMLLSSCGPVTPTATPLPFPPPRLISRTPLGGQEQALDASIELVFDQPMDRASVEAALAFSPTVVGWFTWSDDRTVRFAPTGGWERGTRYRVTIAATAQNAQGLAMEEAVSFDFSTTGYLAVSEVQPTPGADELNPDTAVTVVFNRPVVPLAAIGEQGTLPDPLTLMPPVQGKGEWLNSSIYIFRPAESLLAATRYTARIAAGLSDTTGGVLAEDYTWTFTTTHPAVIGYWPEPAYRYFGPGDVISITFNQPMDHVSVQERFSLTTRESEQRLAGSFRWSGGKTPGSPETMAFVPAQPLPRATGYRAHLAAGATSRSGSMAIASDFWIAFSTVNNPGVRSTQPKDGARNWNVYEGITIQFHSPMNTEVFTSYLTISPSPPITQVYAYWYSDDTEVNLYFPKEPATAYEVTLDAATPDRYGAALGQVTRIRFTTGDLEPYASLNTGGNLGSLSAYTDTAIYAAYRNVSRLDVSLYRISPYEFMELAGFGYWDVWYSYMPNRQNLIRTWTREVSPPRNQMAEARFDLTAADGNPLPPGLYYVTLTAPEYAARFPDNSPSRFMFVRSHVNLTLKQSGSEALVWATDLASGQPVAGLSVTLFDQKGAIDAGRTDSNGLVLVTNVPADNLWNPFFATTGAPGEDGFALVYNNWAEGLGPWDFNVDSEYWGSPSTGYLYTDRPIYRPGQTVYFKGIIRADDDAHYSLPDIATAEVVVTDPQGRELYRRSQPVSDMGTLYSEIVLAQDATLGTYYIEMRQPEINLYAGNTFMVAEYRKPEYQVTVTTDRDAYLSGDKIQATTEATYYFGGPVAQADVHWSVLSNDYWFDYRCPMGQTCPWYDWTDYEWGSGWEGYDTGYGRLLAEGDGRTDDQGRFTFPVAADIAKQNRSQRFTIEASVTDINDQQVSNRTAVIVHKGEFYVGLAPRGYVSEVGREKEIDLITVDWDSQPVSGVPLTVVFMERRWYSVQKKEAGSDYFWDWVVEDIPVLTTTVTTGPDGKAVAYFTPQKAGSYRVRAIGRDGHRNEMSASTYFWVWGGSEYVSWRQESNNRIALIADKKEYQVGDTAEILIPSPYSGPVRALITIERGHVLQSEVRTLTGNAEVLHVPITADYIPNVFVSVIIVQGSQAAADGMASFRMGLVKLPIALTEKELQITITPDKDLAQGQHYGPRQTATFDVLVTDYAGKPLEAELSLRLADLAVLALADEPGPSLLETFWRSRGLGVRTSTPLVIAMERYNRELERDKKGGGGGEEAGLVRTQFADTAYWAPAVRTGKDGKAQISVELPDNLTTWRMQARGVTADTLVGKTDVDIRTTLDLMVRPVLPRFFVVNDKAEIATIIHNNTTGPLDAQVNLTVEGLTLQGSASRTVSVPAQDKVKVTWPVTVQAGSEVKVKMTAQAGSLFDGREDILPVYRYSTPEVIATAGRLSIPGQRQELVQLPRIFDPTQGDLTVQVEGSLTASAQDGLRFLKHYPYECTEQTVSRFLPNVLTFQALKEMGLVNAELEQSLSQQVGIGLQRLYAQQHYDGGWGWWTAESSNPYISAYVLHGLLEARKAGFVVDAQVLEKGVRFLRNNLPAASEVKVHWKANRLAYMLYVLAEYGSTAGRDAGSEMGLAVRLFEQRHQLDHYGKAYLAVALQLLEPQERARVTTLLSELHGGAIVSATGTHWEEGQVDYWNMNTDIRSTAIIIWATSRLEPQSELLPNAVRWLMSVRREGHWETTQNTAWSLMAMVAYMRASGEMAGDFSYNIYLNGQLWESGTITRTNIAEPRKVQIEVAKLLRDEANRLVIERQAPAAGQTGQGQLYYSAFLRYFLPADLVRALDRGIIVARQYSPVDKPGTYVTRAAVGDVIQVKITLIAPTDLHYVVVEDPLPAGFEGVDTSLKTTSVVGEAPQLRNLTAEEQNRWYRWYGWGWWWFSQTEMRDEKVVLFASYLPRGTYEYTYMMRAGVAGEYNVIPTTAYEMYFPEVFGRSDGGKFTIMPGE